MKRKFVEDDTKKKRMEQAVGHLLGRKWVRMSVLRHDGIVKRENGFFVLKLRRHVILTYYQVMEIIDAVTFMKDLFVKFTCDDEARMIVSVEDSYPPAAVARRVARANSKNVYWKNLDLETPETDETVHPRTIWHNELLELKEFDSRSALTVDPFLKRFAIMHDVVTRNV